MASSGRASNIRSSNPSNRPESRITPSPAASSRTRAWVSGGPAGLTAAIYLARFHLDILVVDGGKSRASLIPCTRNHAGFPDGISGEELLQRMRDQACKYGAEIESEFVTKLERDDSTGLF